MKWFVKELNAVLRGKRNNIHERIFCVIDIIGMFAALIALLETMIFSVEPLMIESMVILFLATLISLYIVICFRKIETASIIIGLILMCFVFPTTFFFNGGIMGGASLWLAVNLIYTFLMFDGIVMYIFIVLNVLSDIACYITVYAWPEIIKELPGYEAAMFDSVFSVVVMGLSVGILIKFNIRTYSEKHQMVELQKQELEKISDSRVLFFASMSHEIRTPINTIIGLNEIILRENKDPEISTYAKDVQNAGKLLLDLVNDILDVSQMETQNMNIINNDYNTAEIFEKLIGVINVKIKEKNLDFIIDIDEKIPKVLHGDNKRIQQVLLNLLSNAIKYTDEGSVTLSAHFDKVNEFEIVLNVSVQDTGIGIKKDEIDNLYNIFHRIETKRNRKIEGSGLGLNISKQLMDLMGGKITVDSIYKKGSTFTISLPQTVIDETPIGDVLLQIQNGIGNINSYQHIFEAPEARILVVDDVDINCRMVKKLLERTKVQIDCANSGEECLELTKQNNYNIILLDHYMSGIDGVETLSEIRKQINGLCKDSNVIALTANSESDSEEKYLNKGFDGYIEKPIDAFLLEKKIYSLLDDSLIEYRSPALRAAEIQVKKATTKRKKRVLITTDCVADIPNELISRFDIGVMYLYIRTDNGRFADTIEINSDTLTYYIDDQRVNAYPDSVSVEEYEDFFSEQLTKADEIIHISMASNSGKSFGIAKSAAKNFDHVHIIDSGHVCGAEGLLVLQAAQLAERGMGVNEIIDSVNKAKNTIAVKFVVTSPDSLYQKGYVGKIVANLSKYFHIYPVVYMKKSKITLCGFYHGDIQRVRKKLVRNMLKYKGKSINKDVVSISHVAIGTNELQELKNLIEKYVAFERVYFNKTSFSTACTVGVGALGIAYCKKRNLDFYDE